MRTIEWTNQFKRDYKRESRGAFQKTLDDDLAMVVDLLANDEELEHHYADHRLVGEWRDHRECHIKPDLLLIYQMPDDETLRLVRLGSHSALGL